MIYFIVFLAAFAANLLVLYSLYSRGEKNFLKALIKLFSEKKRVAFTLIYLASQEAVFISDKTLKHYIFSFTILTILYAITLIDIEKYIILNTLLIPMGVLAFINLLVNHKVTYIASLLGVVIIGGVMLIISKATGGGLGLGDVKLFAVLGLWLGLYGAMSAGMLAVFATGIIGAVLLIKDRRNKSKAIPFSPFIYAAVVITLISM